MKHFTEKEFQCNCGCGQNQCKEALYDRIDVARSIANVPFVINCGYRCPSHNAAVGGVPSSAHTTGHAVDIDCPDSHSRYRILVGLVRSGFNRIGIYKTFIHADVSPDLPDQVAWWK